MDIYYKSDFTLIETFIDNNGVAIDMTAIDFKIDYYTLSNTKYTASKTGAVYVNCEAGSTTNQLNVYFAKHGMPAGKLQREITLYITNPDFSPTQKVITNPVSDIVLVAKGGDSATASASVVYPAIVVPPTYYDIKDLTDSTGLRASWTAKIGIEDLQDATTKDAIIDADEVNYLDSENNFSLVKTTWLNIKAKLNTYFDGIYSASNHNHNLNDLAEKSYTNLTDTPDLSSLHTHINKTDLDNVSGSNTGDQASSDFDVKDLTDSTGLRAVWSGKQDALTFSTDIEADKLSTTKVSAIKTLYDWAVGKFIDLAKIVTSWSAIPLDTNLASEKLVKDSLNLKADISPANGSTSALRALFIARGAYYDTVTNTYSMHYDSSIGDYLVKNITETEMLLIFLVTNNAINMVAPTGIMAFTNIRTHCDMTTDRGYFAITATNLFQECTYLEAVVKKTGWGIYVSTLSNYFYKCVELHTINFLHIEALTSAAQAINTFTNCYKLATCNIKGAKISLSFASCPLLTLASLQFLITYRQNATTRITITVHATVWAKLNDAVNYPTWNALLVDAVNNRYIDFASA